MYSWLTGKYEFRTQAVETTYVDGTPVLRCVGELDASTAVEFFAALHGLADEHPPAVVVDLLEVGFVDVHVLSAIEAVRRRLEARDARLEILAAGQPARLLGLVGSIEPAPSG